MHELSLFFFIFLFIVIFNLSNLYRLFTEQDAVDGI